MMDDAELLNRYIDTHSEPAFSELVQRHFNVVFFAALRQVGGDAHRARDVALIVFTDLARKAPKLRGHPLIAGWLYNTTRFVALHTMRSERRRQKREQEVHSMQILTSDSDTAVEWERLQPVVDDVLHELNERDRDAVLMRFFHGKPFADVGTSLGTTADAARFRVDRALARMRASLAKRGITSTSAALALALVAQANPAPPAGLAATVAAAAFGDVGTAISSSTSIGVLKFMTAKTTLGAAIVLLGVIAIGQAWLTWSQATELDRLCLVALEDERVAARIKVAERQVATLEASQAAATAAAEKKADAPRPVAIVGSAQEAARPLAPIPVNFSEAFTQAMDDPEFRKLLAISEKARLNVFYGPLFKTLALSPEQMNRFKELLVDRQQSVGDANRSALRTGMDDASAKRMIGSAQVEINSEIRSLLGETGYGQYLRYEATRGQRVVVDRLQESVRSTSEPLSGTQADQLIDVLYRNAPPGSLPSSLGLGAQVGAGLRVRDLSAQITDQSILAAQAVLAPTQVDALRQLQQQQKERQRIEKKLKPLSAATGGR